MRSFNKGKYKFINEPSISLVVEDIVEKRNREIQILSTELKDYKILIRDLIIKVPKLQIRNELLNIAYFIIDDEKIFKFFLTKKILPIKIISRRTRISMDILEKWTDYIVTYIIILSDERLKNIKTYLKIKEDINEKESDTGLEEEIQDDNKGILLNIRKDKGIILTSKGAFKKIKLDDSMNIGEEVEGIEVKGIRKYKIYFYIVASICFLLSLGVIHNYLSISKTIFIETTAQIKLEINNFNRVIKITSPTDIGEELINDIKASDKTLDWTLHKIVKYASENDLLPEDGIFMTVSGEPIEYGTLKETSKFIKEKEISITVNNVGRIQNLISL